jgi:FkbM family methyltransferase
MRYFIDCGTNYFHGLKQCNNFYSFDDSWKIDCYEANPLIYEDAISSKPEYNCEINFYNKAIWINDDFIDVNINENSPLDNGTNILIDPPNRDIQWNREFNWGRKLPVACVDLSKILKESNAGFIGVKMDIEGAEFEVLQKLIKDDTLKKINHLFVEFHERFFISELEKYRQLKDYLIYEMQRQGVQFHVWD